MKICFVSALTVALIVIVLSNYTYANDENELSLTTETAAPRLPSYGQITAGDQPDHHPGQNQIIFDENSNKPIKFENDQERYELLDIDNADPTSLLADITFDDEDHEENDPILNAGNTKNKVKFDDMVAEADSFISHDKDDGNQDSQVLFEDDNSDTNDDENESEDEDEEVTEKPIKFDGPSKLDDSNSAKTTVKERVKFQDDNTNSNAPVKKNKKPRRARIQKTSDSKRGKDSLLVPNIPYHGATYYGYPPGGAFVNPAYSGAGDPNALYPGYPMPSYPSPGYSYPINSMPYPETYPPQGFPGYPAYSVPPHQRPVHPSYVSSYSGYQGDRRPPTNPLGYPNPGTNENGQPGSYLGPNYPTPGTVVQPGLPHRYPSVEYSNLGQEHFGPHTRYPGPEGYTNPTQEGQPMPPVKYPAHPGGDYLSGYPTRRPGEQQAQPPRYPSAEYSGPNPPAYQYMNQPAAGKPPNAYSDYPGYYNGYPVQPGYPPVPQGYAGDPYSPHPPSGQYSYRPGYTSEQSTLQNIPNSSRRPKSLTQRAVSAVAEALTSIALYDDQQCVPRLLCEVAGGSTTNSPTLLKATTSLQPLLTVLQAYSGVSSSPLFVFGRAAVLGVTSKNNPSTCRYAYPNCPNDPVELVNYLNNHNGGFFRFFGQPQVPQQQQNLEQFYNHLSGQYNAPQQPQTQQSYGFYNPHYGYGQTSNLYANTPNYGSNYKGEQIFYRNPKRIEDDIEGRIQNKPGINALDDENLNDKEAGNSKWLFPDEVNTKEDQYKVEKSPERPTRGSKTLKFPEDNNTPRDEIREPNRQTDDTRNDRGIFFPGQNHFHINTNYQPSPVNLGEYVFDYKHNFYVKKPKPEIDDGKTLYIVRGNGDPNHPEVVKVRPG